MIRSPARCSMLVLNYVSEPNTNLLCCICRMPFVDPVTTRTCSHTFCRDCIVQAISHARFCPVDRSALSIDDLSPANSIIRSLVDELAVECIHRSSGCTYTCQRQLLTAHVMSACPFALVPCPKGECDETLARKDMESHSCSTHTLAPCDLCGAKFQLDELPKHLSQCNDTLVTCESCTLEVPRRGLSAHNTTCPEALVPCPQAPNGCGWTGPRASLASSHLSACSYEAIKGFFALHTTRFARLTEENLILRHKIDTLEGALQTTKCELQSVKTALGPWYRADGVYPLSAYSRSRPPLSSTDLPTELQPASASSSSATPPHARPFNSRVEDATSALDHALPAVQDLAPYFPPVSPEEPLNRDRASDLAARRRTLPAAWEPLAPFGGAAVTPQHTQVAPLNLSTTLEGALAEVRESVVALGGAVDSLGRRSDIALTNEALRLNEEIMSLRANIHGLRMQVHAIMMDRNAQVTGRSGSAEMQNLSPGVHILGAGGMGGGDGSWPLPMHTPPLPRGFYSYPQAMSPGGLGQSTTKL
ncbi:TRAF-type zinc finger protein [Mycena sanguinolenta]|uniref:TRAF-type zinc finger protein n=1 Tax=Mycena sanguinolenta TaxID=230812 RepID=A0A8H6ZF48_9AGAR|nr:TRAF-type zinc finger protein [Mycena sanguinolenta]